MSAADALRRQRSMMFYVILRYTWITDKHLSLSLSPMKTNPRGPRSAIFHWSSFMVVEIRPVQARDLRGQTCLHLASQSGDLGLKLRQEKHRKAISSHWVPRPATAYISEGFLHCSLRSCAGFAGQQGSAQRARGPVLGNFCATVAPVTLLHLFPIGYNQKSHPGNYRMDPTPLRSIEGLVTRGDSVASRSLDTPNSSPKKKLMILMMRKLGSDGRHTTASFCSCCSMETLMSTRLTKTSFQCVTAFHFSVSVGRLTSLSGLQFWKRAQGVAHWMSFQMSWFLEVVRRGVLNAFLTWRLDARATSLLVNGKANLSFRSPIFAASSAVCTCLIISLVCWNSMGLTLGALLLFFSLSGPVKRE